MSDSFVKWDQYLSVASLSDIGLRRTSNQDNLSISFASNMEAWQRRGHFFLVADGMGGNAAGDLASKIAADHVPHLYNKLLDGSPIDSLRRAVVETNAEIFRRGQANEEFLGMGTTCSALLILPEGAVAAHVGDSRVYRLRGTTLDQLTFDHSLVWEIRAAGQAGSKGELIKFGKNYITRALGQHADVQVDLEGPFPVQIGDTFLLCSDGLTGQVADEEIGAVLSSLTPTEAVRALVDLANLRGGPDNITVIAVRVNHPELTSGKTRSLGADRTQPTVKTTSWVLFATALAMAAMLYLLSLPPVAYLLPLAVALISLMWIFVQILQGVNRQTLMTNGGRMGRGPHARCDCSTSGWGLVGKLRDMDKEILNVIDERGWTFDREHWQQLSAEADDAFEKRDLSASIRTSCRATTFLMDQIRSRDPGGAASIEDPA